ncbi:stage II sporulation protein M [Massilia sp. W12]|uniref:stage II sporulation protein M n=1 Tax=Massilia sp. W12 TaxID=3126507 RepID=UPI0030D44BD9
MSMKQNQFEAEYAELLSHIRAILQNPQHPLAHTLPQSYRRLCQCLALAQQRGYAPSLCEQLQELVQACHHLLYQHQTVAALSMRHMLLEEFPRRVRAHWIALSLAMLMFYGVALALALLVWWSPEWAYSFMPPAELSQMTENYSDAVRRKNGDESDFMMFAYYIWNNVSISFVAFASGLFGAVPTLLMLAFNGMHFGVVGAWLSANPATALNFWSFVITHGALELNGIVLCGQAGLYMGRVLLSPGRRPRREALSAAMQEMMPIIFGAASMVFVAAFFEGFFSASSLPPYFKIAFGSLLWLAVIVFFIFAGRRRA